MQMFMASGAPGERRPTNFILSHYPGSTCQKHDYKKPRLILKVCTNGRLYTYRSDAIVISKLGLHDWMITSVSWIFIGPWGHVTSSRSRPDLDLGTLWLRWWRLDSHDSCVRRWQSRARDRARNARFLPVQHETLLSPLLFTCYNVTGNVHNQGLCICLEKFRVYV